MDSHLGRIVNNDSLGQISSKHAEVFQIIALHQHARIPKHSVPDQTPARSQFAISICSNAQATAVGMYKEHALLLIEMGQKLHTQVSLTDGPLEVPSCAVRSATRYQH